MQSAGVYFHGCDDRFPDRVMRRSGCGIGSQPQLCGLSHHGDPRDGR